MGKMQYNLECILKCAGIHIYNKLHPYPKLSDVSKSKYEKDIDYVNRQLGGILETTPLRLKKWDIELKEVAVELDESRHFNRYREQTLQSSLYKQLKRFPKNDYKKFCKSHESACLKAASYGGYWTNESSEKQFGNPSSDGELNGRGSPRWKQRAFYDFVKDLSPILIGIKVVRIAIWDKVIFNKAEVLLKDILEEKTGFSSDAYLPIMNLINKRTGL